MTWFDANISAPSPSISTFSLLTQYSKPSSGSPVSRRTSTDVSIPKRGVMGLIAERLDVEWDICAPQLAPQRGETARVDSPRPQSVSVGAFLQLEVVAGNYPQSI